MSVRCLHHFQMTSTTARHIAEEIERFKVVDSMFGVDVGRRWPVTGGHYSLLARFCSVFVWISQADLHSPGAFLRQGLEYVR